MSDKVFYKTVTGLSGASTVHAGVNLAQILKVSRQGDQKDFISFSLFASLNGSNWTFLSLTKRISFGSDFAFSGDEVIHIIYKVTT